MRVLPKQIWKEEFNYYSDKSVDGLKGDIQQLFDKTNGLNFSVNLTGEFTSENEFRMTPKWQIAIIKNFEREVSYLDGQIFSDELKRTRVKFTVRPNSILPIMFFLFPLIGIFALTADNNNGELNEMRIVGWAFTLVVPLLMLLFAHKAKKDIRKRFVNTFDLKPVA